MSSATVWSTQRVQTQPRTPSPSTLQLSCDGQLLLVGDQDLCIFTPDPDFAAQPNETARQVFEVKTTSYSAAIARLQEGSPPPSQTQADEEEDAKRPPPDEDARLVGMKLARVAVPEYTLAWERTQSHDFRILNTGSRVVNQEVGWQAATWSPSTLSALGGCLIAALTSSNEVFVFEAERDPLTGTWTAIDNVTKKLLEESQFPALELSFETPVQEQIDYEVRRVYDAQTTALAWSPQPAPRSATAVKGDMSLLALGAKGGVITLWQWAKPTGLVCVGRGRVEEQWISTLAWSEWELTRDECVQAALSYSTPSGVVKVLTIKQDASGTVEVEEPWAVAEPDDRPLTALKWLGDGLLAWAKVGEVYLAHVPLSTSAKGKEAQGSLWDGWGRWRLKRFGPWPGSSRLATCCGIDWYSPTSICFSLANGSHHIITLAEESVELSDAAYNLPLSRYLTTEARKLFEAVEKPMEPARQTVTEASSRVVGCYRYDGCWAWAQQPTWDYDLSYLQPKQRHVTLLLAEIPLVAGAVTAQALDRLVGCLSERQSDYLITSPLVSLFPTLLPFYVPVRRSLLPQLSQEILEAISPLPPLEAPHASTGTAVPTDSFDSLKAWFRTGLRDDLWGSAAMGGREDSSLLKRLGLAEFFAEREGPLKEDFSLLQDDLSRLVLIESAVIMLGWVARVKGYIRHADDKRLLTLLTHVALTSLLRPSPTAPYRLQGDALAAVTGQIFDLSVALQLDLFVNLEVLEAAMTNEPIVDEADGDGDEKAWYMVNVGETCPACGEGINFDDIEGACCSNGHEWDRCSLTLAVMSTPQCRRCLHCARPTRLQPSSRFNPRPLPNPGPPTPPPPLPPQSEVAGQTMELDEPPAMLATTAANLALTSNGGDEHLPPSEGPVSPASTVADVDMGGQTSDSDEDLHVTLHVHNGADIQGLPSSKGGGDDEVKPDVAALETAWLATELLESATCCLYCGGRFALAL